MMETPGWFCRGDFPRRSRSRALPALLILLYAIAAPMAADANPFLPKPGDAQTTVQVATCAVSGGFVGTIPG
jgi:hypothetical protein